MILENKIYAAACTDSVMQRFFYDYLCINMIQAYIGRNLEQKGAKIKTASTKMQERMSNLSFIARILQKINNF